MFRLSLSRTGHFRLLATLSEMCDYPNNPSDQLVSVFEKIESSKLSSNYHAYFTFLSADEKLVLAPIANIILGPFLDQEHEDSIFVPMVQRKGRMAEWTPANNY